MQMYNIEQTTGYNASNLYSGSQSNTEAVEGFC